MNRLWQSWKQNLALVNLPVKCQNHKSFLPPTLHVFVKNYAFKKKIVTAMAVLTPLLPL